MNRTHSDEVIDVIPYCVIVRIMYAMIICACQTHACTCQTHACTWHTRHTLYVSCSVNFITINNAKHIEDQLLPSQKNKKERRKSANISAQQSSVQYLKKEKRRTQKNYWLVPTPFCPYLLRFVQFSIACELAIGASSLADWPGWVWRAGGWVFLIFLVLWSMQVSLLFLAFWQINGHYWNISRLSSGVIIASSFSLMILPLYHLFSWRESKNEYSSLIDITREKYLSIAR